MQSDLYMMVSRMEHEELVAKAAAGDVNARELHRLRVRVLQLEGEVFRLQQDVSHKDMLLALREERVQVKDRSLASCDRTIKSLQDSLACADRTIANLTRTLASLRS